VAQRLLLVLEDLEEGQDLRQVERVPDPITRAQELDHGPELVGELPACDQLAHATAVHAIDLREIEQDLPATFRHQSVNDLAQQLLPVLGNEVPVEVNDDHILCVANASLHGPIVDRRKPLVPVRGVVVYT
jgi:hypothetical protein